MQILKNNETVFITMGGDIRTLHSVELKGESLILHVYDMECESGTIILDPSHVRKIINPSTIEFAQHYGITMSYISKDLEGTKDGWDIEKFLMSSVNNNNLKLTAMKDSDENIELHFGEYLHSIKFSNDTIGDMAKYLYDKYYFQRVLRHDYTQAWIDSGIRYSNKTVDWDPSNPDVLAY